MRTASTIHIRLPREKVFAVVSDLARWPLLLPHCRAVDFLGREAGHALVRMKYAHFGLPLSWLTAYRPDPATSELHFEPAKSGAHGLRADWKFIARADTCQVSVIQDLRLHPSPLARLAEPLLASLLVEPLTHRTLRAFKTELEAPPTRRPFEMEDDE